MRFPRKLTIILILVSLIVLAGCGSGDNDSGSNSPSNDPSANEAPATEVLPTEAPPTEAPPEPTEIPPTIEPTATEVTAKVSFDFVTEFGTIEELDPLLEELEQIEGILGATGSEFNVTITYDPDILTEDALRKIMKEIGRPIKE